jgi:hypothetical protein
VHVAGNLQACDGKAESAAVIEGLARCTKPPMGWSCSRDEGHEGPCAAAPSGWTEQDQREAAAVVAGLGGGVVDVRGVPILAGSLVAWSTMYGKSSSRLQLGTVTEVGEKAFRKREDRLVPFIRIRTDGKGPLKHVDDFKKVVVLE